MLAFVFLIGFSKGILLFGVLPESLALLLSGVCLIGGTAALRKVLKRYDMENDDVKPEEITKN